MIIINKYLTQNDCYKSATKMKIKGLMLHSVGCNVENPMNFINSWNKSGVFKCVHAFIGQNAIYETLPYNYRAWHCGRGSNGSFNDGYISAELTEPKSITYVSGSLFIDNDKAYTEKFVKNSYANAVWYFAYLCKKFNLNPLQKNVIVSHSEGYKLGYASNHGDVEHIWNQYNLTMDKFRQDVYKEMIKSDKNKGQKTIKDKLCENQSPYPKKYCIQIDTLPISVNSQDYNIDVINIKNFNYVKLDDLKKAGLDVNFDNKNKKISISF